MPSQTYQERTYPISFTESELALFIDVIFLSGLYILEALDLVVIATLNWVVKETVTITITRETERGHYDYQ